MTKQEAIDHFDGVKNLAKALDIWPTAISRWKEVPKLRQFELEKLTDGKLKADD